MVTAPKITQPIQWIVLALLGIFYSLFLVYPINLPAAEDLPRQIKNGEMILHGDFRPITDNVYSYVEPSHAFANHHWLYGVYAYIVKQTLGYPGLVVIKVLVILLTLFLLFRVAWANSNFWIASTLAIPTILLMMGRTAARPEIFGYLLMVLFIYILDEHRRYPDSKKIFWLIPLQLLWVNTHITFPLGIGIAFAFTIERLITHRKEITTDKILHRMAAILAGLALVCFINPFGLGGVIYSLLVNTSSTFPIKSAEVQSLAQSILQFPVALNWPALIFPYAFVLLGVTAIANLRRMSLALLLLAVISGVLAFSVIRGIPIFAIMFMPAMAMALKPALQGVWQRIQQANPIVSPYLARIFPGLFVALLAVLIVVVHRIPSSFRMPQIGLSKEALSSADFFKANHLSGPIFNDTDIGSYLIGELYPDQKVFGDNRFGDAYSAEFFKDIYNPILTDEVKWKEALQRYQFDTIFMYQYTAGVRDFLYRRFNDSEWVWVYLDSNAVILVRNTTKNQPLIDKYRITRDNLDAKLQYLLRSNDPNIVLAGADIYSLVGYWPPAMYNYLRVVAMNPYLGKVWSQLGKMELTKSDQANSNPALALIYMQNAIRYGWRTPESYSYLALAYFRLGDLDAAEAAVKKELRIDPSSADGKQWLGSIAKARGEAANAN